jgi:ribonuclease HI
MGNIPISTAPVLDKKTCSAVMNTDVRQCVAKEGNEMDRMSFDGSCDPNPGGRMGWSYIITFVDGRTVQDHRQVPAHVANTVNVAEYRGLRDGLHAYLAAGSQGPLRITGDSQLIINQVNGVYKVRKPELKPYHAEVVALAQQIRQLKIEWNPREHNTAADQLARGATVPTGAPVDDDLFLHNPLQATLHSSVAAAIARLNANPAPGFKDFAALRTGGSDAFSKLALAAAEEQAGSAAMARVTQAFVDPKAQASALRWALRGLGVRRAIRKVEVDAEVATRARR